jgi:hypothetical protein
VGVSLLFTLALPIRASHRQNVEEKGHDPRPQSQTAMPTSSLEANPAEPAVDRTALLVGAWRGLSESGSTLYHHRIVVRREGNGYVGEGLAWCGMTEAQADAAQRGTLALSDFPDLNTNAIRPLSVHQRFEVTLKNETVTFRSLVRDKMAMVVAVRFADAARRLPSSPIPILVTRVEEDGLMALAARPEHGTSQPVPAFQRDAYDQLLQKYEPDRFSGTLGAAGIMAQDGSALTNGAPFFRLWKEEALAKPQALKVERGKTVTLACLDSAYHYTCFLPSRYDPAVPTPVLMNFSPDGNAEPLSPKRAESLGWIMIGLTESRNGPWEPVCANRDAVLFDLRRRFNIDMKRIYFSGLSGGARAAALSAASYPDACAGLLCIGASSKGATPAPNIPIAFLVGETDINRPEVEGVYHAQQEAGRSVRLALHPGGHTWGRPEDHEAALQWLASQAPAPR